MLVEEKTQVSLRVPAEMLADIEKVASALDRDRTWVMLRSFRRYLDEEGADILQEIRGLADLETGRGADFDEVLEKADAIIAKAESRDRRKAG